MRHVIQQLVLVIHIMTIKKAPKGAFL